MAATYCRQPAVAGKRRGLGCATSHGKACLHIEFSVSQDCGDLGIVPVCIRAGSGLRHFPRISKEFPNRLAETEERSSGVAPDLVSPSPCVLLLSSCTLAPLSFSILLSAYPIGMDTTYANASPTPCRRVSVVEASYSPVRRRQVRVVSTSVRTSKCVAVKLNRHTFQGLSGECAKSNGNLSTVEVDF